MARSLMRACNSGCQRSGIGESILEPYWRWPATTGSFTILLRLRSIVAASRNGPATDEFLDRTEWLFAVGFFVRRQGPCLRQVGFLLPRGTHGHQPSWLLDSLRRSVHFLCDLADDIASDIFCCLQPSIPDISHHHQRASLAQSGYIVLADSAGRSTV